MKITRDKLDKMFACESAFEMFDENGMELNLENCEWFIDNFVDKDHPDFSSWESICSWLSAYIYGQDLLIYLELYYTLSELPKEKRAPLLHSLLIDKLEEIE